MKLSRSFAIVAPLLLALPATVYAAAPDLSRIASRADLDAVIAATPDVALKQALTDHAAAILAAAEQHRHVEAVIHTIEKSPGRFTKVNKTPEALKNAAGGEVAIFDTLTMVNTNIVNGRTHQHRDAANDPYDAAFIEHLGHIPALESVSLVMTRIEDSWLEPLPRVEHLRLLLVEKTGKPGLGDGALERLRPLANVPSLRSLSLHGFLQATDAGLEHLAGLENLEHLSFHQGVRGHAFAKFEGWTNLKSIRFHGNDIDDEGFAAICDRFPNLETLNLIHARQLTDASGVHLRRLSKLKHIFITDGPNMTAAWLENARDLPLESLLVNKGPATPPAKAIAVVRSIPSLRRLSIDGSRFTDADLASLAGATQLTDLTIGGLELPDDRLPQLQAFDFLKNLATPPPPKGHPPETEAKLKALLPKVQVKL